MKITVYVTENCVQCAWTKRRLDEVNADYVTVDLKAPENAQVLADLKAEGFMGAPIVKVQVPGHGDRTWSGFRPDLIKSVIQGSMLAVSDVEIEKVLALST